ncbi:methylated-DNA--[protein]-cysteine S-methyltransferase [Scopulibacillus cellulosilyticus]|uniref:Methylated-DNA--[protein]-cysteine S-methyltransferase n=1 Tax=Scopulibacillus cellulosilyticus TaxID=2665665 RepID=A0ABW2Q0P6_9BACL
MINNKVIYWSIFIHNQWKMHLAATSEGLCYVGSNNKGFKELLIWAKSKLPDYVMKQDDEKCRPYADELAEYFNRKRMAFNFPVDCHGTEFQLSVWKALRNIPYGDTFSYSDIADIIQKPNSVRAVGAAIGANPILIAIPCHRVIGKNRKLTGYRGGLEMKKQLLILEKESLNIEKITEK